MMLVAWFRAENGGRVVLVFRVCRAVMGLCVCVWDFSRCVWGVVLFFAPQNAVVKTPSEGLRLVMYYALWYTNT